nr:MAG TPA: hypothetical protein [Caudoviricetes sp.]DAZ69840.1 MAG TPA: hypothetical protein [Caudoviricetes sp.]
MKSSKNKGGDIGIIHELIAILINMVYSSRFESGY